MKKTIFINARFLTKTVTGVQRYAREMIKAIAGLKQDRYDFTLVTHRGPLIDLPIVSKVIQDDSVFTGHMWEQLRLPYLAIKHRADIIWSPCNVGPIIAHKHVLTIHDASVYACPGWFSKRFSLIYRIILPILGRTASRIVTDSNFSKTELIKYGVTREMKLTVINCGVDPSFFTHNNGSSRKIFNFRYVLAMGSVDPRKNIKRILNAWEQLPNAIKQNRKLIILGNDSNTFSSISWGPVPKDVNFLGYLDDKELAMLYAGADVFVYPSLYEGFGFPPLEAMSSGCPVVASNVASLPEVCGDAAYYVNPYNIDSIAEGMHKVLSDEILKRSLINKGFERVKEFAWERAAKNILKVFDEVLESMKG